MDLRHRRPTNTKQFHMNDSLVEWCKELVSSKHQHARAWTRAPRLPSARMSWGASTRNRWGGVWFQAARRKGEQRRSSGQRLQAPRSQSTTTPLLVSMRCRSGAWSPFVALHNRRLLPAGELRGVGGWVDVMGRGKGV
jgi:hypothetical protein